jgi:hypothetical protein
MRIAVSAALTIVAVALVGAFFLIRLRPMGHATLVDSDTASLEELERRIDSIARDRPGESSAISVSRVVDELRKLLDRQVSAIETMATRASLFIALFPVLLTAEVAVLSPGLSQAQSWSDAALAIALVSAAALVGSVVAGKGRATGAIVPYLTGILTGSQAEGSGAKEMIRFSFENEAIQRHVTTMVYIGISFWLIGILVAAIAWLIR